MAKKRAKKEKGKKLKSTIPIKILTFLLGVASGFFIQEKPLEIVPHELSLLSDSSPLYPKSLLNIKHSSFLVEYDCRTKNANWVYEKITEDSLRGNVDRKNCHFKEDGAIPLAFRSTLNDYRGSGFDRGHLAPAADHENNEVAMEDTFYLSNMSPQVPEFNREYWSKLERYVRNLTKSYKVVEVFTGPLYVPEEDESGKKWVKYQIIGKSDIAVPTHFFKVLILKNALGNQEIQAYILPNKPIDKDTPLKSFIVPLQKVEKLGGLMFFTTSPK